MESDKLMRNLETAISAPQCAGVLRFDRGGALIAQKQSGDIQDDLLLVAADPSSPLRQATEVTYEIFHFL
jgi:hypothetical protein